MAERVGLWWARRQFSRDAAVPYPVGTFRDAWAAYPALIRQYHPDLNEGITLTQIPPAADVLLCWQCEAGHLFAATPAEQRSRPGRTRRRSAWCPECTAMAVGRVPPTLPVATPAPAADTTSQIAAPVAGAAPRERRRGRPASPALCTKTPDLRPGTPFTSTCAPARASRAEGDLHAALLARLEVTTGANAVRVARPFHRHLEVWPDIVLEELRVAIEYDTTGRHGLEHVGDRERSDCQKDRLLRAAGWEVVRVRTSRLTALGPHDVLASGTGRATVAAIIDELRTIRGALLVDAYVTR